MIYDLPDTAVLALVAGSIVMRLTSSPVGTPRRCLSPWARQNRASSALSRGPSMPWSSGVNGPRPTPLGLTTGSHLLGSALHAAAEPTVRPLAVPLAELKGRTYHDVADVLARPNRHVAVVIREQVGALRDGDQTLR